MEKKYILSKNNNVIERFYGNKKLINFVLAKYQKKIIGILGFIPNFQFDYSLKKIRLSGLPYGKLKK